MSANPYEPPYCEASPVDAEDVRLSYLKGRAEGYEQALRDIVSPGTVRAANDALWTRPTGSVLEALIAVAEHLRAKRLEAR